ncbi:MAG TPA: hypothetical protein VMT17_02000 [Anaeromyxobacteraceae bacterium]|nr:hypothetical protein [Anaeromyxobacteraceae bacterium]
MLALVLLAAPGAAWADAPSAAPAAPAPTVEARPKLLGLQLAAGLPDGVVLSLVYRPWYFLRLSAGPAYNYVGFGVQGAATLVPFHFPFTPTLTGEAGYFFPGNVNARLDQLGVSVPAGMQGLLSHVGYTYLSSQLGLEFGGPEVFVFYIRFGLAWLFPSASGTATGSSVSTDITVTGFHGYLATPAANIGFVVYIW